jgi:hypothetical protein
MVKMFVGVIDPSDECVPTHGECTLNIKDFALKGTAGQSKAVNLFQQDSVESFFRACRGSLFDLTDAPFWVSLTNSSSLVIDAPNDVNIPGKYQFYISIWQVTLEIDAPCSSNYLQGPQELGHVSVYIDDVVFLFVNFELDDQGQSWKERCGSIQRAFIHNAPTFVKYSDRRQKIEIKPQDKVDKGAHKILIEIVVKSVKSFHSLEILVKLPATYIDS